jgi:hypothetical protein
MSFARKNENGSTARWAEYCTRRACRSAKKLLTGPVTNLSCEFFLELRCIGFTVINLLNSRLKSCVLFEKGKWNLSCWAVSLFRNNQLCFPVRRLFRNQPDIQPSRGVDHVHNRFGSLSMTGSNPLKGLEVRLACVLAETPRDRCMRFLGASCRASIRG